MKHSYTLKLASTLLLASCVIPHARSSAQDDSPYLGMDYLATVYQYDESSNHLGFKVKYRDLLANHLHGLNPHVGMQFGKYLGTELGYFRTVDKLKSYTSNEIDVDPSDTLGNSRTHLSGYHADILGHVPMSDSISLLGSVGAVQAKMKIKLSVYSTDFHDANPRDRTWRLGIGALYKASEHLNVRFMLHYMQPHFEDAGYSVVKDLVQVNLGVNYTL